MSLPKPNPGHFLQTEPLVFPFPALVGQAEMKLALLLGSIDPGLGGVLILGERGTAKSTAARGLARLWPEPVRLVTLPLGATEDRIIGSLDLEAAIRTGRLEMDKGLLSRADGGILYIDEVNLLDEHLAALILDASVSGWVALEREGLSQGYPARFLLIGTMNPEEGRVPPQLLDRFGLSVSVSAELNPLDRRELIRRRLEFENDSAGFKACWRAEEERLAEELLRARGLLAGIDIPARIFELAALMAGEAHCAGQRAEICLVRAARANAARQGRNLVLVSDLTAVAGLALAHRQRDPRPGKVKTGGRRPDGSEPLAEAGKVPKTAPASPNREEHPENRADGGRTFGLERVYQAREAYKLSLQQSQKEGGWLRNSGRRLKRETRDGAGRYVRASMDRQGREVALDATFRAAAPHQSHRDRSRVKLAIATSDIREKVKVKSTGRLVIFVVDGSGSMGSLLRMREAKAAILSLLAEAYQKRDRVGLIAFRGPGAEVVLPPTNSVELAQQCLEELPTGGKTPLAAGLLAASQVIDRELVRDPKLDPLVVLLTDGKPNVTLSPRADAWEEVLAVADRVRRPGVSWLIVDTDWDHWMSFNVLRRLSQRLQATHTKLDSLRAEGLVRLVRENI